MLALGGGGAKTVSRGLNAAGPAVCAGGGGGAEGGGGGGIEMGRVAAAAGDRALGRGGARFRGCE
jgi:hypothetical protein